MMRQLFANTAQAIYSVGRPEQPALTAQARPQDGDARPRSPLKGLGKLIKACEKP